MNESLEMGLALPSAAAWLLEAGLRGAVVGCAAAAGLPLLRGSSAGFRHAVWAVVALAMVAMPLLSPWTPPTPAPVAISYGGAPAGGALAADAVAAAPGFGTWAVWLWAAVSALLLLRVVIGWLQSRVILARSRAVRAARAVKSFEEARERLRVRRFVRLLESDELPAPVAAGLSDPAVVLPASWRHWSASRLEAVLLHELAHIARRDIVPAGLAAIGRCLFWFNPLAWYAERRVRSLAEQSCDEIALRNGCAPADYAEVLVEIAAATRSRRSLGWAALAMARKPSLSERVDRVLSMDLDRSAPGRNRWFKAAAIVAPVALLAASLAPAQSGAGVRGVVLDPSGARVPRARVILLDDSRVVATKLTNGAGEFEINADPGSYGLAVSAAGFALFSREQVVVTPEGGDNLEIQLRVESVEEELVIGPADPERTPKRIRVGGAVQRTRLIRQVNPEYPADAKAEGVQGTVILDAVIGVEGTLASLRVRDSGADSRLVDAAVKAVREWRYRPTLLNGQPVEVETVMEINFTLAR